MIPGQTNRITHQAVAHSIRAGLLGFCAFVLVCAIGTTASAQSAFGCRALETHNALPAVEGADGVFFRVRPDLQAHQAMAGQTITQIADLSKALAARGTTLVFLPVPGRAQVLAHQLPAGAAFTGYDPDLAWAVQRDMFDRLRKAGVSVADPREALRTAALRGSRMFFETDPRPTPEGARIMAQVLTATLAAHPDTKDLPRGAFSTTKGAAEIALPSSMRAKLQLACQDALPEVRSAAFSTAGDIAIDVNAAGIVAVIGTEMTGTDSLNFAGFLSELSGLRAGSYGVEGGGAFAAISSYLTSVNFRDTPPQVLVWEVPVWEPFANNGDQPMAELIAAAAQNCTIPLALSPGASSSRMSADLGSLPAGQPVTFELDASGVTAAQVTFHFTSVDDQTRSRAIYRHAGQIKTGRFYMPLSGLEHTGLRSVEIELPEAFGPQPRLRACLQGTSP